MTLATVPPGHAAYRAPGDTRCNKEDMQSLVDDVKHSRSTAEVLNRPPPVTKLEYLSYDLRVFLHVRWGALHPTPSTLNTHNLTHQPSTRNTQPQTPNPKP